MIKSFTCGLIVNLVLSCNIYCIECIEIKKSAVNFGSINPPPISPIYENNWHLDRIQAYEALEITEGLSSFSVGFIDSGIDGTISDISSNTNSSLSIDCYGNHTRNPLNLPNSHGTSVVGLFGASGNLNDEILGVTRRSSMAVLETDQPSDHSRVDIDSVFYAFSYLNTNQQSLPIFNCSVQFTSFSTQELSQVMTGLCNYSGLGVVAAGNGYCNLDQELNNSVYYDFFTSQNLIIVGASDIFDCKCDFSNYGQNCVDLFAPGAGLYTYPLIDGNPKEFSGTCGAAPLVSGTAALIKSVNPNLTPLQIKALIMNNVDYVEDLSDKCVSGGRLNCYKAVKAAIPEINSFGTFINGIQPLPSGDQQFYKLTLSPGTYTFETCGNMDASGYLYGDIQSDPVAYSTNDSGNFSFTFYTFKQRDVYLKIVNNSSQTQSYSLKVSSSHVHNYNHHYIWYDGYSHLAYCSCGLYQSLPHIVGGISNNCIMCGGQYTGPMSMSSGGDNVGNDSILLSNGTIILGTMDYNYYLSGDLDLNSLLEVKTNENKENCY